MTLSVDILSDALAISDTDEFAESLTYTPHGGTPKTVKAFVDRAPVSPDGQIRGLATTRIRVLIPRDATNGVTSVTARDTIAIPLVLGGETITHRIEPSHDNGDPGFWHLTAVR